MVSCKVLGFFPPRVLGISPGRLDFMEALEVGITRECSRSA